MGPVHFDHRTDEQILNDLQTFRPVDWNSERNIWAFWDSGLAACKPWCQRNIIGWVRRHDSSWTVRVLDNVDGSPNHFSRYVPNTTEFFPQAFVKSTMTGIHKATHMSDLIRLPLLHLYGGIWLDVGFMLFRDLDDLCWNKLEDPTNTLEMAGFKITISAELGMVFNGFIAGRKGCELIKHWHNTFLKLWVGADSTAGMSENALLRHLPRYALPSQVKEGEEAFPYALMFDYLVQIYCLERVRNLKDPSLNWDGPTVFAQNVLLYECYPEVYWAQHIMKWDGRKQFELLCRQREGQEQDEKWKEAEKFVDDILGMSSTMKLSRALVTERKREYLARIWDEPENADADWRVGTFAARLRWASIHFKQTKELVPVSLPMIPDALLTGGLFDEVGTPHPHWEGSS